MRATIGGGETAIASARHVRRFGVTPKIALCSHSQFGNLDYDAGRRMRAMAPASFSQRLVSMSSCLRPLAVNR